MIRTIVLLLVSALAAVPVMAQTPGPGGDKAQKKDAPKNAKKNAKKTPAKEKAEKAQPGDDRPGKK